MRKVIIAICLLLPLSILAQGKFEPLFDGFKLVKVLEKFKSEAAVWKKRNPAPDNLVRDTTQLGVLQIWRINSIDFNEPIYAIYTDTATIIDAGLKKQRNYITSDTKLGSNMLLVFYYGDGTPLKKSDVATLRKEKDIPGVSFPNPAPPTPTE